ncbi:MAG: GFA family protein [Pseudomonadota bacterium]
MAELREVIVTCNPHTDSVPRISIELEQAGFQVRQVLEGLGIIVGGWDGPLEDLQNIDGVAGVELSHDASPMDESAEIETTADDQKLTGRCFCGVCSWETAGPPNWVCHCHCESCRRNCAAPFTSFFGVDNQCWKWTGSQPNVLRTDAGVSRFFCAACGTPLAYHNVKWNHETHFYLACLDNPGALQPQFHVHWQEKLPWVHIQDDLPKYAGSADDG